MLDSINDNLYLQSFNHFISIFDKLMFEASSYQCLTAIVIDYFCMASFDALVLYQKLSFPHARCSDA